MDPVDADELEWETLERGETSFRRKRLADAAGGDELGCSLYELPPGKHSWPYHYHAGNEEALFVLAGTGSLRCEDGSVPLTANDYVALPAGEDSAHRIVNDTAEPLRYLMFSTMHDPDLTVYPDSGKVGVFAGAPPGGTGDRSVHGYYRLDDDVDYWEDEEDE